MKISRWIQWIQSASASHCRGCGLLVDWAIQAVTSNIISLIANEVMPSLGLEGSVCRPKIRLRGLISLKLLFFFFFNIESQAAWLSGSRDPLGHSPFGSLGMQRPSAPIEIAAGLGQVYLGISTF